jgi:hypothetical protein
LSYLKGMKHKSILILSTGLITGILSASAQDSCRPAAATKINKTSAEADKLQGKKIQQQTLFNNSVEKLDTSTGANINKKKATRRARKQS